MINGNAPISERYRLAADEWVKLVGAARLLEETKTAVLSQMMASLGDMPVSRAELTVKSTDDWKEFVTEMVKARTAANEQKVKVEYLRMQFAEWNSNEANARIERKL